MQSLRWSSEPFSSPCRTSWTELEWFAATPTINLEQPRARRRRHNEIGGANYWRWLGLVVVVPVRAAGSRARPLGFVVEGRHDQVLDVQERTQG